MIDMSVLSFIDETPQVAKAVERGASRGSQGGVQDLREGGVDRRKPRARTTGEPPHTRRGQLKRAIVYSVDARTSGDHRAAGKRCRHVGRRCTSSAARSAARSIQSGRSWGPRWKKSLKSFQPASPAKSTVRRKICAMAATQIKMGFEGIIYTGSPGSTASGQALNTRDVKSPSIRRWVTRLREATAACRRSKRSKSRQ